jgi:voltage-gated potassium channel
MRAVKNRIWDILESPDSVDRVKRVLDPIMIVVVLASVTGVILRTVPSMRMDHLGALRAIEFTSVAVFTIEFFLRLWIADLSPPSGARGPRLGYLLSAEGLVDLAAIVPFYLALAFPAGIPVFAAVALLRIFKLVRYSPALATLLAVIANERKVLAGMLTIMLVLLLFSSTVVYLVERTAQPEKFGSIPAAMWWGIATLTTVGYGDVTPITPLGKLFGGMVEILGIGMFALPAGILSSGFAREIRQREMLTIARLVRGVPLFSKLNACSARRYDRDQGRRGSRDVLRFRWRARSRGRRASREAANGFLRRDRFARRGPAFGYHPRANALSAVGARAGSL